MRTSLRFSAVGLASALAALTLPAVAQRSPEVDRLVGDLVGPDDPGVAVLVARDGEVLHRAGYGLADIGRRIPITTETVFELASVSKQFTALAVLILAQQGRLSLDDDVQRFLPEIMAADADRPIRIVDLLHMISGLADYIERIDDLGAATNEDAARVVGSVPLRFPTGSRYVYSNTDYAMLGLVVARASGSSYAAFLRGAIFEPAGMRTAIVLERPGQEIPNRAMGYRPERGRWVESRNDTGIVGDGQVCVSAEDLLRYDVALRRGGLVDAALLAQAYVSGRLDSGERTRYGFGVVVGRSEGRRFVRHGGGWSGTSTHLLRYLDGGLAIIVLSNNEEFESGDLAGEIARLGWEK